MSTARRTHASLYNWIVYKQGSKAKERKGEEEQRRLKQGSFIWSSGYVITSSTKFYQSCNITPPPLVKPTLRLYVSILHLQGVFIFMFFQQLIIFTMLALYLLIQVLQGSWFIRVTAIGFLKLIGTANKVLYRVLGRVWVMAFLIGVVLQRSPYQLIGQYFF